MRQFNFTLSEILSDGKSVDVDTKKSLAAKYGIESNKSKEIAHQIYAAGLEIVKTHTEYDNDDMLVWNRYYDFPESAQKLRSSLAGMTDRFIEKLIEHTEEYAESQKRCHWRCSWAEKKIRAMQSILDERHQKDDRTLETIVGRINDQIDTFHHIYVQNIVDWAGRTFDSMLRFKNVRTLADVSADEYVDEKIRREVLLNVRKFRAQSNDFDRNYYLERARSDAERNYDDAVILIAKRCEKAGLVADTLYVYDINAGDAKAFDIYLSDGVKTMHARSIFCAEYSSIVTPHWRFIITNA